MGMNGSLASLTATRIYEDYSIWVSPAARQDSVIVDWGKTPDTLEYACFRVAFFSTNCQKRVLK